MLDIEDFIWACHIFSDSVLCSGMQLSFLVSVWLIWNLLFNCITLGPERIIWQVSYNTLKTFVWWCYLFINLLISSLFYPFTYLLYWISLIWLSWINILTELNLSGEKIHVEISSGSDTGKLLENLLVSFFSHVCIWMFNQSVLLYWTFFSLWWFSLGFTVFKKISVL